jgi:hypothetical protein
MLGPRHVIRQGVAAPHPLSAFTERSGRRFNRVADLHAAHGRTGADKPLMGATSGDSVLLHSVMYLPWDPPARQGFDSG